MNNTTYSAGTVSVGASSTTVTGVGTLWSTGGVRAGDVLVLAGLMVIIASVNSNTSITLKRGWPGVTQSGANYDILMLDDATRALPAVNTVLAALNNGTLSSFAALTSGADKMAYFTGSGTMATADLTTAARSLLAASLLSVSGNNLVTAASARVTGGAVQTSRTDVATPEKLVRVDGARAASLAQPGGYFSTGGGGNIDTAVAGDCALYHDGNAGTWPLSPAGRFWAITTQATYTGDAVIQTAVPYAASGTPAAPNLSKYWRYKANSGGVWSPWLREINSHNILGTVSQTGGIPTGAIIETNVNANGRYTRFASGLQICSTDAGSALACATADGQIFKSAEGTWTFPAAFNSITNLVITASMQTGTRWVNAYANNTSSAKFVQFSANTSASTFFCRIMAIGRWF